MNPNITRKELLEKFLDEQEMKDYIQEVCGIPEILDWTLTEMSWKNMGSVFYGAFSLIHSKKGVNYWLGVEKKYNLMGTK